jgi:hypothetical protein
MIERRIPPAGDPFYSAGSTKTPERSTRHHRVDDGFLGILEEDFGIPMFALNNAFLGVPAEPKKQAIAVCEWAAGTEDPARALLAWARKNGRGTFRPDLEDVADDDQGGA